MGGIVFVIQEYTKWDPEARCKRQVYDLTQAEDYGELRWLFDSHATPFEPGHQISKLRKELRSFNSEDSLLLLGNPCLIGWATAVAAQINGGVVHLLQWSGKEHRYVRIRADLER